MSNRKKSSAPLLLAAVIALFILFLIWAARQASTGGTDITDSDYYSKGLKYNETLVEKRAASVIGWHLQTELVNQTLKFNLTDRQGEPITGANGRLALPEATTSQDHELLLQEDGPGIYHVTLPQGLSGEQLVRIEIERDGARISRQLLLSLPPRPEMR
mgnify:CR=1 FL=1